MSKASNDLLTSSRYGMASRYQPARGVVQVS